MGLIIIIYYLIRLDFSVLFTFVYFYLNKRGRERERDWEEEEKDKDENDDEDLNLMARESFGAPPHHHHHDLTPLYTFFFLDTENSY